MRAVEIEVKISIARREMEFWQGVLKDRRCVQCESGETNGWCSKHQATPPKEVQQTGCDDWAWCEIPF